MAGYVNWRIIEKRHIVKACMGCMYYTPLTAASYFCDYIGYTGKSRPCEAGAECTVRQNVKTKRRTVLGLRPVKPDEPQRTNHRGISVGSRCEQILREFPGILSMPMNCETYTTVADKIGVSPNYASKLIRLIKEDSK